MSHGLENREIRMALYDMDDAVSKWQSARMRGNYVEMCLAIGMMYGLAGKIYTLNHIAESNLATPEVLVTLEPQGDENESACEEEHQTHNAPESSSNPNGRTHPAILATTDSASDQELGKAEKDCPDLSSIPLNDLI